MSPWTRVSRFIPTTTTILEFAEGRPPKPTDRVVYVTGSFDLFHIGHLSFLEKAKEFGDYLIVGILSDQVSFREISILIMSSGCQSVQRK